MGPSQCCPSVPLASASPGLVCHWPQPRLACTMFSVSRLGQPGKSRAAWPTRINPGARQVCEEDRAGNCHHIYVGSNRANRRSTVQSMQDTSDRRRSVDLKRVAGQFALTRFGQRHTPFRASQLVFTADTTAMKLHRRRQAGRHWLRWNLGRTPAVSSFAWQSRRLRKQPRSEI